MRNACHLNIESRGSNDTGELTKETTEELTEEDQFFVCPEPGCGKHCKSFHKLEIHAEIRKQGNKPMNERSYNPIKRDWAEPFITVDPVCIETKTKTRPLSILIKTLFKVVFVFPYVVMQVALK